MEVERLVYETDFPETAAMTAKEETPSFIEKYWPSVPSQWLQRTSPVHSS